MLGKELDLSLAIGSTFEKNQLLFADNAVLAGVSGEKICIDR